MLVNLNSLKSESVDRLEDAGLLFGVTDEEPEQSSTSKEQAAQVASLGEGREIQGTPWFEEMIQGSQLGKIKRRRGGGRSSDGRTVVEYEITEFESGDGETAISSSGKRKHGSLGEGDDVEMKSS